MKILLVCTPFESPAHQTASSYPLGLIYLASVLEKEGHEIIGVKDYLFEPWEDTKSEIEDILINQKPEVVLISCMTTNRTTSFKLAELVHNINQKIIILMGGVHPSVLYNQILKNYPVDFIVIGEGEKSIVELIWSLEQEINLWKKFKLMENSPYKEIKGIAFKNKNEVIKTEPREPIKNLDELLFPKHSYFKDRIKKYKTAFMMTARGCPYNCSFCNTCRFWGRLRRQRSVNNVMEEIINLKKRYPDFNIYFNDDEFLIDKEFVINFCKAMKEAKLNIKWECIGRVNSISKELVLLMKEAGCERLDFGVESGSQKILDSINKGITREQVIEAYKICKECDMSAGCYIMVGLPGETKETVNETISLLKQCPNAEFRIPAIFQIFPGNLLYEQAKSKGFINDDYWLTDKPAPYYTYENSKKKLVWWALKIALYHKYYQGKLCGFLYQNLKSQLKWDKIKRIYKQYLK